MGKSEFFMDSEEVESTYGVDLITAETLRNGFIEATRHMYGALLRSSFSNAIRDGMDFGVCVHLVNDDGTTELLAITEGCTQFAFTHQHMTNMVLDEYGIENMGPGDTLVCNDAFRGGIHFGDLNFFRVIHDEDGRPAFVVSDAAHVFDIGGPVGGGFNNTATSIYEEGLRIPPMLLMSGDMPVRSTMNLLMENTRNPMQMLGDIRALLGTLRAGEERIRELSVRYGPQAAKGSARYSLGLAERRMRQALLEVPDGDFSGEVSFDDDGISSEPITLRVEVRIRGAEAEIDFSGTDPQSLGPITTGWEEAARAVIGPKIVLDPRHPMNAGAMRPFQVLLPPGSMVLGLPPTSQSGHCEMATKIARLMISVMSKAFPPRAVAQDSGTTGAIIVFGHDTRPGLEGVPFGGALVFGAAWGGTQAADGVSFCLSPLFNCRSNIIEYSEKALPLVIWEYGIVQDSAGPGRYRGGFAASYAFEALSDTFYTPILDGARFAPEGLDGGGDGTTTVGMLMARDTRGTVQSWNGIVPAERLSPMFGRFDEHGRPNPVDGEFGRGTRFQTTKPTAVPLEKGQVLRVHVACPGGYGDPLERDVQRVQRDVANERISLAQAQDVYGVVIDGDTLAVDEAATEAARRQIASDSRGRQFGEWPVTEDEFQQLTSRPVIGSHVAMEV
jgi:N-methylhydantoinase B